MKDPEQLIDGYLHDSLDKAEQADLHTWLAEDESHLQLFTDTLMLEEDIRNAVRSREQARVLLMDQKSKGALPRKHIQGRREKTHRLARAAAWLGAFSWLGNKAQAASATAIIMNKTLANTVTATLVLATMGTTAYIVHDRTTKPQSMAPQGFGDDQRGQASTGDTSSRPGRQRPDFDHPANEIRAMLERWTKLHKAGPYEFGVDELNTYQSEVQALDAETLRLLLEEVLRADAIPPSLVQTLFLKLMKKSPSDATVIGVHLVTQSKNPNRDVALYLGDAFEAWLVEDPAAANEWFLHAQRNNELTPKGVQPKEDDSWAPDRRLAGIRFAAMLKSDIAEAEAMMAIMRPKDVALALSRVDDPSIVARITEQLPSSRQYLAANSTAFRMASKDFNGAIHWVKSLQVDAGVRDELVIQAVSSAMEFKVLDLAEFEKSLDSLPISAEGRPQLLFRMAAASNLIKDAGTVWDSMNHRTALLRRHLSAEQADQTTGRLLGYLSPDDMNKAIESYQQEAANSASNANLATAFAAGLRERYGIAEPQTAGALKAAASMPEGQAREQLQDALNKLTNP